MAKEKTLGEKRAGINGSTEPYDVVKIRKATADIINYLETLRPKGTHAEKMSSEKQRLISIAQTKLEEACMFAVKAIFAE
ncbi:hypothetical protein NHN20_09510 [Riemerella anatipestifer]|uniref:Acb2/Tad1 domain-containing protein n=1 Tax=Riemerella anatipestifer TaxID=34085 RepID=UPI00209732D0|nr:hypothetical protein [Riemerella anatipestifer]MCO7355746.1 hypothetical protein [Riemerella anatipestifer]